MPSPHLSETTVNNFLVILPEISYLSMYPAHPLTVLCHAFCTFFTKANLLLKRFTLLKVKEILLCTKNLFCFQFYAISKILLLPISTSASVVWIPRSCWIKNICIFNTDSWYQTTSHSFTNKLYKCILPLTKR